MCVTFYSGIFPFQTFAQKFLIEARHLTPGSASLFVGIVSLASMVGSDAADMTAESWPV